MNERYGPEGAEGAEEAWRRSRKRSRVEFFRSFAQLASYSHFVTRLREDSPTIQRNHKPTLKILMGSLPLPAADIPEDYEVILARTTTSRSLDLRRSSAAAASSEFRLRVLTKSAASRFDAFIQRLVRRAVEGGIDIVTLNEMGFPAYAIASAPLATNTDALCRDYFAGLLTRTGLTTVAAPLLVLPGSSHCLDGFMNISPIFAIRPGTPLTFDLHVHQKLNSAYRVSELVRVPAMRELTRARVQDVDLRGSVLRTTTIVPAACLDLYDATQLYTLVRWNLLADFGKKEIGRVDVVIVNSYGMRADCIDRLFDMLSRLSLAMGSLVVLAASTPESAYRAAFYLGDQIAPPKLRQSSRLSGVVADEQTKDSLMEVTLNLSVYDQERRSRYVLDSRMSILELWPDLEVAPEYADSGVRALD